MNVHFTARHLLLPPELKAYAQKRLSVLEPVLDPGAEVDVILSAEKNRLRAEILVRSRRSSVRVAEDGRDLAIVMNEAFDILEKNTVKNGKIPGEEAAGQAETSSPRQSSKARPICLRGSSGSRIMRPNR
ncbi:MAG: HPF/RaiA family ribosome-associated protein [Comamonadaceae bacterium]|nr:HPF/RaiA family ribosome-associated protein [Comamonadaceae bacterium]